MPGPEPRPDLRAADDGQQAHFFRKMFKRTSELGKIGVWECDLATEALTWTDTVYDLFDVPRQSLVTRATALECYEPTSRHEMERLRAQAIAACTTFTVDVAIRSALGNERWIRITGDVEQTNGRAARIFGTKQDITREKLAQLQIQSLQTELIHLSRLSAIDAMKSTLAHELNQPLAALAGYVSALQKALAKGEVDPAVTGTILEGIESCTLKAGTIMRNVRTISLSQPPVHARFNLASVISQACTIGLAGAPRDLRVWEVMQPDLHGLGDPVQIQQVVINLLKNACDALADCEMKEITIATAEKDGFAEVSVRDCGRGLADGVIATLFDPFASANPGVTSIGLSISRTIIEKQGGKLTAESPAGGGSTLRFTMPLAP